MTRTFVKKPLPKAVLAEKLSALVLSVRPKTEVPLSQQSDEQLMHSYKAGEARAFDLLLARHQRPLFNFIYRFLRNEEAAEEAFQEVFVRVIRNREEYRETAKFTTWLYTIARNLCIDELRKKKFRNHAPLGEDDDARQEVLAPETDRIPNEPETISAAKELEVHLEAALQKLSAEQREVFLLRHFENMPFDEIARVSDLSVNTVKSRMRYALQHIEKYFHALGILGEGHD